MADTIATTTRAKPGTRVKIGPWEWTHWPTLPMPTEQWLREIGAQKGPAWLHEFNAKRERQIQSEIVDPLQYGWETPPIVAARDLLAGRYVPGRFGVVLVDEYKGQALAEADDLLLMTGNRFGKSNFGGKLVNETMKGTLNARVRCWSQSEDTSVSIQQVAIFKHLSPHLRSVKSQGQFCKISYKAGTGFSEGNFLFPQSGGIGASYAQCFFMTYHSWQQDNTIAEGPAVTLTWCDEEVPAELLETLRYRVGDTKMLLLVTFTPISGYTEAVGQYIEGARVIEAVPARRVVFDFWQQSWSWGDWLLPKDKVLVEGCPPGHVPFLLESTGAAGRYCLCASTAWNPYVPLDEVVKKAERGTLETKLIRIFGWPLRKVRPALSFTDKHIVSPTRIPPLSELTLYLSVDPCPPPRNWYMVWLGVDRDGRVWVLAEWPDHEVGEWAVPGSEPDGKPGPGAYDGGGRGFDGYKLLIYEREGWVEKEGVWTFGPNAVRLQEGERLLDPRAASWKVPSEREEEAKSYIDCLQEPVLRHQGSEPKEIAPGLDFVRAPAAHIQEGNELINDWLTQGWDPKEPLTPMNAPRFYINTGLTEEQLRDPAVVQSVHPFLRNGCRNTIWALRTFTGKHKNGRTNEDSACKDPIDCLKGAAKRGVRYVAPGSLGSYGGWGGY